MIADDKMFLYLKRIQDPTLSFYFKVTFIDKYNSLEALILFFESSSFLPDHKKLKVFSLHKARNTSFELS